MTDPTHQFLPYLPVLIAVVLLIRRTQKPRVIRPAKLWIVPAILVVAVGFYTFGAVERGPPLHRGRRARDPGSRRRGSRVGGTARTLGPAEAASRHWSH